MPFVRAGVALARAEAPFDTFRAPVAQIDIFPTAAAAAQAPRNLSTGFTVEVTFGFDPKYRPENLEAMPRELQQALQGQQDLDFVIQVWGSDGRLLYGSHPQIEVPAPESTGFSVPRMTQAKFRICS